MNTEKLKWSLENYYGYVMHSFLGSLEGIVVRKSYWLFCWKIHAFPQKQHVSNVTDDSNVNLNFLNLVLLI